MGRVVDLARLPVELSAEGVSSASVTNGETREFAADHVRIAPSMAWSSAVPAGSDVYLFTLAGDAEIVAASYRSALPAQSFATIGEGVGFTVTALAQPVALVAVTTPPKGSNGQLAGFAAALEVAQRAKEPVVAVPEQKKTRVYFCGHHHGAHTHRGHAMIVGYETGTRTDLHHHPDAESMFVMIDGACRFTVDGEEVVVGPGQAACFGINDRHGLTTAPGHASASFLEFHIPAAFTTVKA